MNFWIGIIIGLIICEFGGLPIIKEYISELILSINNLKGQ